MAMVVVVVVSAAAAAFDVHKTNLTEFSQHKIDNIDELL